MPWLPFLGPTGVAPPDPDLPAPESPTWNIDPGKPATYVPEPLDSQLTRGLEQLATLVELLTPGVPGVEGAEAVPELQHAQAWVRDDDTYIIPGNARRRAILLHNVGPGTIYVVADRYSPIEAGMPIPESAEREIQTTNPIRLRAVGGPADLRVLEESS